MSTESLPQEAARLGLSTDLTPRSVSVFLECVVKEERRVDYLLACPGRMLGWFGGQWQKHASEADVILTWPDVDDPEFRKNLRIFRRLISDAAGLCQRAECRGLKGAAIEHQLLNLTCRIKELEERIRLPKDRPLTLKVLLGCRFTLEQLLIDVGDDVYVSNRAAALYSEDEGTVVTWKELFNGQKPPLLISYTLEESQRPNALAEDAQVRRTRSMVAQLLAAKEADDMPLRARRELKQRAFYWVAPLFVFAAGFFAYAMERESIAVLLPAVAGMTGAALGMLFKLRDELKRGSQIREFLPFAVAQLVVGATAGLFVSIVEGSGLLNLVNDSTGVGAIGFVMGYSEAAFLGLVGNIAKTSKPSAGNSAPT
jgi:hypothetical protein